MASEDARQLQLQLEKARSGDLSLDELGSLGQALEQAGKVKEAMEVYKERWKQQDKILKQRDETLKQNLEKARSGDLSLDELDSLRKALEQAGRVKEATEVWKEFLKQWDERWNRNSLVLAKTIDGIYRQGDSRASFPQLQLNKEVQPSIEGHHLKGMDRQRARYEKEDPANGTDNCNLNQLLKDVVVPTTIILKEGEAAKNIPSDFDPQDFPLQYQNEIGIHVLVEKLVQDAIACLGCKRVLQSTMEISFYGITPDIVVIYQGRQIIFVIEVKAPNGEGRTDNVFENDIVGGQVWLYLMAMKQAGIQNPLGAICNFNQIRIVSLNPMRLHPFKEAASKLKEDWTTPWNLTEYDNSKQEDKPSPDPKRRRASDKIQQFNQDQPSLECDNTDPNLKIFRASLYGSEIVGTDQFFPMLLLGLMTSKIEKHNQDQTQEMIPGPQVGENLGNRLFAYATEKNIKFAMTTKNVKLQGASQPPPRAQNSFLLDSIGAEWHGRVSRAASTSGHPAAIKFFHFKPSRLATADQRKAENEEKLKNIKKVCDEELKRWTILYPTRQARSIKLMGVPCLVLPYGTRIAAEDRKSCLGFIQTELKEFGKKGFAYNTMDLCWRDVLKDFDGKVFLSDLGSLDILAEGSNYLEIVERQMRYLEHQG